MLKITGKDVTNILNKIEKKVKKFNFTKLLYFKFKNDKSNYEGEKSEFKDFVLPFWEKYNIKPNIIWYKYYGVLEKSFNPLYIPDDLFYCKLLNTLNNKTFHQQAKNILFIKSLFFDAKTLDYIFKYSNNIFIDENKNIIPKNQVFEYLSNNPDFKIISNNFNKDYTIHNFSKNKNYSLDEIEKLMQSSDFLVVKAKHSFEKRIRLSTILINGKVEHIVSSYNLYNKENKLLSSSKINSDGYLDIYEEINGEILKKKDDNKIFISQVFDCINIAKKLHPRIAFLQYVVWEFLISENNDVVLFSINNGRLHNQRLLGPAFGDYTELVLDSVLKVEGENE